MYRLVAQSNMPIKGNTPKTSFQYFRSIPWQPTSISEIYFTKTFLGLTGVCVWKARIRLELTEKLGHIVTKIPSVLKEEFFIFQKICTFLDLFVTYFWSRSTDFPHFRWSTEAQPYSLFTSYSAGTWSNRIGITWNLLLRHAIKLCIHVS